MGKKLRRKKKREKKKLEQTKEKGCRQRRRIEVGSGSRRGQKF